MISKMMENARLKRDAKHGVAIETFHEAHAGGVMLTVDIAEMVIQFHKLFQHPIAAPATPTLLRQRANLICEEGVDEICEALEKTSLEKVIDSMADSLYVGIGTLVSIEGAPENALAFFTQEQSELLYLEFQNNMAASAHEDIAMGMAQFEEVVTKLRTLADQLERGTGDATKLAIKLRDTMNHIYVAAQMVYRLADMMGLDVLELVGEVHRSNMSKLWPEDAELRAELVAGCKYDKDDLAFRIAEGRDGMIGYRISDGKILKSPTYEPADLSRFVAIAEQSFVGRNFI